LRQRCYVLAAWRMSTLLEALVPTQLYVATWGHSWKPGVEISDLIMTMSNFTHPTTNRMGSCHIPFSSIDINNTCSIKAVASGAVLRSMNLEDSPKRFSQSRAFFARSHSSQAQNRWASRDMRRQIHTPIRWMESNMSPSSTILFWRSVLFKLLATRKSG
jgi:hypothetical protein